MGKKLKISNLVRFGFLTIYVFSLLSPVSLVSADDAVPPQGGDTPIVVVENTPVVVENTTDPVTQPDPALSTEVPTDVVAPETTVAPVEASSPNVPDVPQVLQLLT